MKRFSVAMRSIAVVVLVAFGYLTVVVAPARAALVGTDMVLETGNTDAARVKVRQFLEREDVAQRLQAWGVTAGEARDRVDAMTAEEVNQLSERIDQVPAGGDVLGFILALALISFITLIVLDILGVTDIFTFIKKR
jgi:hypothetical protein